MRNAPVAAPDELSPRFSEMCAAEVRPSPVPREFPRPLASQIPCTILREQLLIKQLDDNLLFR